MNPKRPNIFSQKRCKGGCPIEPEGGEGKVSANTSQNNPDRAPAHQQCDLTPIRKGEDSAESIVRCFNRNSEWGSKNSMMGLSPRKWNLYKIKSALKWMSKISAQE